jgi:hypothetical protein
MKRFASLLAAAALSTSGAVAFAAEPQQPEQQSIGPVQMTEAELDNVTAGLIDVYVIDVLNNNQVQVAVPVNAAVAAGVLGNAVAGAVQRPGRQVAIQ